ncbi:DUF881 domain-containing protein [Streptomyces hoynatensis]|uniref:DUF881 domain-containing protein n=1 Tax=Streptomyces hoynatensis TaxID=1141874 RepID=A0A3A9ZBT7_9ACTN|nr:DUF881 domain-containing protein [Streptomyces hoynatensis]RKN44807.1 DUF881 domain-containing protein [Streptomyces hoynatensis]
MDPREQPHEKQPAAPEPRPPGRPDEPGRPDRPDEPGHPDEPDRSDRAGEGAGAAGTGEGAGPGRPAASGAGAGEAPGAARPAAAPAGARALASALWPPRATRSQLLAASLLFVLGLGLAIQVRATGGEDSALRTARPEDLVRILSDLEDHTARLQDERAGLLAQRSELESSSDQAEEARRQTERRTRELGVLAGTVTAEGEGIVLHIGDRLGVVGADMLLDAVQELRAAGAEAIQVNDVRVVAETSFVDENGGVVADGHRLSAPYELRAIGRPRDLEPALNIPGGVVQSLENQQVSVSVDRPEKVTVDALRAADQPDYAQSSP